MTAGPSTVAAVIGDPVRHSRSPAIHNAAFEACGLDWVYTAFEIPAGQGAAALRAMKILGLGGLSVTMPHKAEVAAAVDEASESVGVLGAANCVVRLPDGRLRAENTDVVGFVGGLEEDAGISPCDRKVAVLGAGGAARAVVLAVRMAGAAEIVVVNRSLAHAEVAAELAGPTARVGSMADVSEAEIVVNATSVGMANGAAPASSESELPCPVELIESGQVVVDLIYSPLESAWIGALRARGVEAHNGLSMLVHQAAAAFELWTGVEPPLDVMRRAALATHR